MLEGSSRALPPARREFWIAAVAACVLSAALLWEPISKIRTHTLGPWDWLTNTTAYLRPDPPAGCVNAALTDPVRQALPWAMLAREELAHGRLPLWNARNGTGVPLLANYQSALLSPFTWPHYVLPLKLATLVSAFARIACAALFTFLFLRAVSFSRMASALGAIVYGASSGQVLLLLHPHSAVTALLPLALWCVERLVRAAERRDRPALVRAAVLTAIAGGLSGLAGHPEMLLASGIVVALYAAVRLAVSRSGEQPAAALALCGAAVLAFAIAAPQIVPFVEYLGVSVVNSQPTRFLSLFDVRCLALLFFPHLDGTPVNHAEFAEEIVKPAYQEQTTYYIGALPILFALAAVFLGVARTRHALFAALALVSVIVVWNVADLGQRLGPIVSLGMIPVGRFYSFWTLAGAVLAAWTIDRASHGHARLRTTVTIVACAVALYAAARCGAHHFIESFARERGLDAASWTNFASEHVAWIGAWYWSAVAAAASLPFARATFARWIAVGVLCAGQFATVPFVVGGFVSTVDDSLVLPKTLAIDTLRARVGDGRVLFFGDDEIPADANAVLGVRSMTHYDAVGIYDLQAATTPLFGAQTYAAQAHKATSKALRTFGVQYVSARVAWLPIDTATARERHAGATTPYLELGRTGDDSAENPDLEVDAPGVRQIITARADGLSGIVVHFRPTDTAMQTSVTIALRGADNELVARREIKLSELSWLNAFRIECVLAFPPIADSAGKSYAVKVRTLTPDAPRVRLASVSAQWNARLDLDTAGSDGDRDAFDRGPARADGSAKEDRPFVVDAVYGQPFLDRRDIGDMRVFEIAKSKGRAWIVSGVTAVASHAEALDALLDGAFEPYDGVILEGERPSITTDPELHATLVTSHDGPQLKLWRAATDRPAHLVVADAHYPGWEARVDGREVPLLRANYAFSAIELPPGEHEVEMSYEPHSVKLGFALGAIGWLAIAVTLYRTRRGAEPVNSSAA